MDPEAEKLLDFWLKEVGPEGWFRVDESVDAEIRKRWLPLWEEAAAGGRCAWRTSPRGTLALVTLLDQFPRNMFRGEARAFSSDPRARAIAKWAILAGTDRKVDLPERSFLYLPLMHSELPVDQDQSVRLYSIAFGKGGDNLKHAVAHRSVIREFGRFPFRNAALGRSTRPDEQAFLDAGGYAAALAATTV